LIAGNIGYWTTDIIKRTFGEDHVVIVAAEPLQLEGSNLTCFPFSIMDEKFESIFFNYDFDRVIYVSDYLTFHGQPRAEVEELRRLLRLCQRSQTQQQIAILLSQEACANIRTGKTVMLQSEEELCRYYAEVYYLPVKIIRCPFLCSAQNPTDYFYRMFQRIEEEQKVEIAENPEQRTNFIRLEEVGEFLFRLFDDWDGKTETLNLFGCSKTTFADLAAGIEKTCPGVKVEFLKKTPLHNLNLGENYVRSRLGWFAVEDVALDVEALYREYRHETKENLPLWKRVREQVMGMKTGLMLVELVVGWILVEALIRLLSGTAQFGNIDLRLLFIVVMGSVYGMNAGVTAAFLETVAAGISYVDRGISWQMIFYEPSNWVPFILYFTVGAICGYVKRRNEDTVASLKKERDLLADKYRFTRTLYQEALEYKSQYKKQIIGSRDSFGKIFEVVQNLDTVVPQEIYAQSIAIIEDVLDNRSIAIYSIRDPQSIFGRLEVSSHLIDRNLAKSIRLEQFSAAVDTLKKGEIWVNTELLPDYPMYIAGVKNREGELILMIMIYRARYDQLGMYYANLFRIICGLIESSFRKAWDYQNAVREKVYIDDTVIANEEYFARQLSLYHNMLESGIASYGLIQIAPAGRSLEQMDSLLRTRTRETDLLGRGKDGNYYLLLSQVDNSSVGIVMKRLTDLGLSCRQVSQMYENVEAQQ